MAGGISTHRRRILCALMLLALASIGPASASIKQANLDDRPLAFMEKVRKLEPTFPARLASDSEVFVIVYAASASSDVYVLARPSVEPAQLARTLQSAVKGTPLESEPVMYMSGEGYSWADAYVSRSRLWSRQSEMRQPVGLIISRLQEAGLKPHVLVWVLKSATKSHKLGLRGFGNRRAFWAYVPANRTDLDFTLRASLSTGDIFRTFLVFFDTLILALLAIPVLIFVAYARRSTPGGRRSLVTGWFFWIMMFRMAIQLAMSRSQLHSPLTYRVQDLWFGEGSVLLVFLLPLLAPWVLIGLSHVIARLVFRGDTPESKLFASFRKHNLVFIVVLFAVFVLVDLLKSHLPATSLLARSSTAVVILLSLLLPGLYTRIMRGWVRMPGSRTPDVELHQRFIDLARRSDVDLKGVDAVDMPELGDRLPDVLYRRGGRLLVPRVLTEKLSPEELDFLAAREFALAAQMGRMKTAAVAWMSLILIPAPLVLLIIQPYKISLLNWPFWCVAAGLALLAIDAGVFAKRRDTEADRRALAMTGAPKTAIEAIRKASGLFDSPDDVESMMDPKAFRLRVQVMVRLQSLKRAVDSMDLDSEAGFQEMEQDAALTARTQEIADRLGVKLGKVEVIAPLTGERLVNAAALKGNRIVVGRALVESFSPKEIDWVLAHELAHLKRRDVVKARMGLPLGLIMMLVGAAVTILNWTPTSGYALGVVLLGAALVSANAAWLSRRRELEADRMALRITRDLPAALSALEKLAQNVKIEIPEEMEGYMTHPRNAFRVRSLIREAKRLGLPDVETQIDRPPSEDQVADTD